ncbi:MAG: quinolinate synthase NadA [Bacteroidales bacterium]|jgi:quinolinate synthase|nr:quinolinate synthase NadA [Bacteroidales bacterium]
MREEEKIGDILKLKKEKDAIILGHFYQIPQIQDISDFVGDSLLLAQKAKEAKNKVILFCGVHFMGETAKILNPDKKVIIPDMEAGCSLADSCPEDKFIEFKKQNPDHLVISYINCSAKIKALSDIICTSGNALKIVESLPKDQKIIFAPDKNLGGYINRLTGRNMLLWDGSCEVHQLLTSEEVLKQKIKNPDAILIAHPECNDAVLQIADFVGSTSEMISFVNKDNKHNKFLVATETGIVHKLQKDNPEKTFIVVTNDSSCSCNDCRYMKLNTIDKVLSSLREEKYEILLDEALIEKAKKPIERMLSLSKELKILK